MARRIDIELTSARTDGTWTWRAAGAMQPRGVVNGELLPDGSKAGDVVRAEADFEIDGIVINSVLAPKEKKRSGPERIELITPSVPAPGVTTQLVGRAGDRHGSERRRPRSDDGRKGERRGGSADRGRSADRSDRTGRAARPDRPGRAERPGHAEGPDRRAASDSAGRGGAGSEGQRRGGPDRARSAASSGPRPDGRSARRAPRSSRDTEGAGATRGEGAPARRLNPSNTHRQSVLASLPPEQQAVAEQVLRGGIPAVRTAVHLEREKATAEGRPAPNADALLALAEDLRPRLRAAEWRDRADAAVKVTDTVALRDLRSVVAGADLARDEEARQLAVTLRDALEARLTTMRNEWVAEIDRQLEEGRVVRALRVSSRAPEATTRLSAEQASRLSEAAGAAMSPATPPDRWAALLEAVAASPVRRSVKPAGLPEEPGATLLSAAQQQSGRIPALAALLGITMPPPPGPVRPVPPPRRPRPARPPRPQRPGGPPAEVGTEPTAEDAAPTPSDPPQPTDETPTADAGRPDPPQPTDETPTADAGRPEPPPATDEAPTTDATPPDPREATDEAQPAGSGDSTPTAPEAPSAPEA